MKIPAVIIKVLRAQDNARLADYDLSVKCKDKHIDIVRRGQGSWQAYIGSKDLGFHSSRSAAVKAVEDLNLLGS